MRTLALVLGCLALLAGCPRKNTAKPVVPTQPPPATGSGDQQDNTPSTDTDDGETPPPPPTAATFGPIYFAYDSNAIDDRARTELARLGDWLSQHPTARAQVAGHTDERGTVEYNIALGERRADAVKDYLVRLGIAAGRIVAISYGEERPAVTGEEERSWGLNRRCEFQLADR